VRPHDVVARYGGEEFMIVMPDTPLPDALQAAQRILSEAVKIEGPSLPPFTISLGLAEWSMADGSVEAMVARADTALYTAKANGRNRVEIAGDSVADAAELQPG